MLTVCLRPSIIEKVNRENHLTIMILAFCNPLIDATVEVEEAYLHKWDLKNDDAILADSRYQPLINETVNNKNSYMTCGGACQNTLVMSQWMMQKEGKTAIVGAVGNDSNQEVLRSIMNKSGVQCLYQTIEKEYTGCSAILVCNGNRSIVASVAASGNFEFDRWDTPEVLEALENAKVVLMSTFFLRSSDRTGLAVAAECCHRNIPLAISLSSPTAIDSEAWPSLRELFRVSSIVFGNNTEIICLAKKLNLVENDVPEESVDVRNIIEKLSDYGNPRNKRIIISTMGKEPTIGCESGSKPIEVKTISVSSDKIVDTNGAGDSFAGGFLAYYIKGESLQKCIEAGNYCASCNIQERGCSVPKYLPSFK
ncbi:Adenosine kinase [Histomonas meleagridis]|uniref:Adenosine kinase n=1 Tax=Histomonas meleagridis TaxID=135588 RepID=UPI00355A8114|nr:Adenosine kinase [Histomonas meleagridis]KAH0799252.1 Adenosine kinase [Histomonas meleagridis]